MVTISSGYSWNSYAYNKFCYILDLQFFILFGSVRNLSVFLPRLNIDQFLESTTPLVPAQYLAKVDLILSIMHLFLYAIMQLSYLMSDGIYFAGLGDYNNLHLVYYVWVFLFLKQVSSKTQCGFLIKCSKNQFWTKNQFVRMN